MRESPDPGPTFTPCPLCDEDFLWGEFLSSLWYNLFCQYDTFITTSLRLALIFFIFMFNFAFFTLNCLSTLVYADLVGKSFGRFACLDLGSMFTDAIPWPLQVFLTILLLTGKTRIFTGADWFDPISWDSGNFQQWTFCFQFKA